MRAAHDESGTAMEVVPSTGRGGGEGWIRKQEVEVVGEDVRPVRARVAQSKASPALLEVATHVGRLTWQPLARYVLIEAPTEGVEVLFRKPGADVTGWAGPHEEDHVRRGRPALLRCQKELKKHPPDIVRETGDERAEKAGEIDKRQKRCVRPRRIRLDLFRPRGRRGGRGTPGSGQVVERDSRRSVCRAVRRPSSQLAVVRRRVVAYRTLLVRTVFLVGASDSRRVLRYKAERCRPVDRERRGGGGERSGAVEAFVHQGEGGFPDLAASRVEGCQVVGYTELARGVGRFPASALHNEREQLLVGDRPKDLLQEGKVLVVLVMLREVHGRERAAIVALPDDVTRVPREGVAVWVRDGMKALAPDDQPCRYTSTSWAAVAFSASQTMRRAHRRSRDVHGSGCGQGPGRRCGGSLARYVVDNGSGRSGNGANAN
eukprot:6213298-Pleurochrysis_carterae.AAC.6